MTYQVQYTSIPATYSAILAPTAPGSSGNTPGGYAPTIYSPSIANALPASISHIVALDERNREYFEQNTSTFTIMRVTIHTTGAWEGSVHSDNHVTVFLILDSGGAVQVDMRTDAGDRRGQLLWKLVSYQQSSSEIKHFNYQLGAPVQVKTLYTAIRNDWSLHQYLFSAGGSGCHYWNYVLLSKIAHDTSRFSLHPDVPAHAWRIFGRWYSRTGAERPNNPIQEGRFQDYAEWWNDWFTSEEEEDEEDGEH